MDEGDGRPQRDERERLSVPPAIDVRRDAPAAGPRPELPSFLQAGEPSEVRTERGRPADAGTPPFLPDGLTETRRLGPPPRPPADSSSLAVGDYEARRPRREPDPEAARHLLLPPEFEARTPRPSPSPLPRARDEGPFELRSPSSHANNNQREPLPSPGPIEVRHDQPVRTQLPPLPVNSGRIEIQENAGRQRVRVMTTGVFDLIHLGHLRMLEAARALGDELYVVIARDETVRRMKHDPLNREEVRRDIVQGLKPVTKALLGRTGDIYQIVAEVRPHIIALGYDQKFDDTEVRRRCSELGIDVNVVRLPEFEHDLDATRKIIERIADRLQKNELYRSG